MGLTEQYNTPFEQVEVIVHFFTLLEGNNSFGQCRILKVIWQNTIYKVTECISDWDMQGGKNPAYSYMVRTDKKKILQLKFELLSLKWTLIKWDNTY